jgi:deoxyribose-phosphate aldolase
MSLVNANNIDSYLSSLTSVDAYANQEIINTITEKKIAGFDRYWNIKMAISCIDLTSLEFSDTEEKIFLLYLKALNPYENDTKSPSVAALCIYPKFIPGLKNIQAIDSPVKIATVAGGFPLGNADSSSKIAEVSSALAQGADEIDFVLNRSSFLAGNYANVFAEVNSVKKLTLEKGAKLKVIIETGELGSEDNIKKAATLVLHAGADFVKTSTGKLKVSATYNSSLLLMQSVFEYYNETGIKKGIKPSGGFRSTDQALFTISMLKHTLGNSWLNPELFRFGASGLLDQLVNDNNSEMDTHNNESPTNTSY